MNNFMTDLLDRPLQSRNTQALRGEKLIELPENLRNEQYEFVTPTPSTPGLLQNDAAMRLHD